MEMSFANDVMTRVIMCDSLRQFRFENRDWSIVNVIYVVVLSLTRKLQSLIEAHKKLSSY